MLLRNDEGYAPIARMSLAQYIADDSVASPLIQLIGKHRDNFGLRGLARNVFLELFAGH
jgi:hypothetical protein